MTNQFKNTEHHQTEQNNLPLTQNSAPQGYFVPMPNQEANEEINIRELFGVLVEYKRLIAAIVIVSIVISIIAALLITPVYRAEVLLAPAGMDNGNKGGIAALASQFGGLAGLAGISVGGGGGIETAIATLKSRKFITHFIADLKLKPILFKKQWNNESNQWVINEPSLFRKIKNFVISTPHVNLLPGLVPGEPSPGKAYKKFFGDVLKVSQDKKTQLVTVSVEWENPQQSAKWANALVQRLNEELRQKTIDEAERSIAYLTEQISQTSLSELQNVLYRLIEEHTKIITLAKVNDEYVLKVIDPAVSPEIHSKPNRKLIVILGLFLGLMFGMFIAFILNAVRNRREAELQKEGQT